MKIPMTRRGFEALKEDLERLKRVERPKNIQQIAEARAHGDLSENAEYSAAKERQSLSGVNATAPTPPTVPAARAGVGT
jgi:transcription elongation factor GreA